MPQRAVRKAVLPAAGLGTRFLPITKAQPKEMLPLVDKPAIQYVVEEAVSSGISDVLIVTGRGKGAIEDHFDRAPELERYLEQQGKHSELAELRALSDLVDLHFVRQGEPKGLGHAVSMARRHIDDEPFAVMLGDDIMDASVGVLAKMITAFEENAASVIALKEVPEEDISSYGCARVESAPGGLVRLVEIVEKPSPQDAPSNLAVMGRYVLTPSVFEALDSVEPGRGGEIQLTDAIALMMQSEPVYGLVFSEGRWDTGNKLDWLRATVELALRRKDIGPPLREAIIRLLEEGGSK